MNNTISESAAPRAIHVARDHEATTPRPAPISAELVEAVARAGQAVRAEREEELARERTAPAPARTYGMD